MDALVYELNLIREWMTAIGVVTAIGAGAMCAHAIVSALNSRRD